MRTRNIWLVVSAAALFALQAPLCALACVESSAIASAPTHAPEPPCHDDGSRSTPVPGSGGDCCCALAAESAPGAPMLAASAPLSAFVPPGGFCVGVATGVGFEPAVPSAADLPPPDILLRKSTLLI